MEEEEEEEEDYDDGDERLFNGLQTLQNRTGGCAKGRRMEKSFVCSFMKASQVKARHERLRSLAH